MVRNIIIVFLSLILIFVLYKYHSTRNYLDFIKNKINTEDMTLYKEGEGHFSIISNDKQFTMAFAYNNTYGFNSIGVWDELSKKILVFNFSEEGELRSYKYEDGKYFVTTNVLFVPLDNKFITRAEFINDYETIYELFEDGTVKITFRDIETGVWE